MKNSLSSSIASGISGEAIKVSLTSAQWHEQREQRGAADPEVTVVSPAVQHRTKLVMAIHESPDNMYGEPIDKGPRSGVTKQVLDDRPIGRSKPIAIEAEQLDCHQAPLVDRFGPERIRQLDDLVMAQRWIRRGNPLCHGADGGHAGAIVHQLTLQIRLLVQGPVRCTSAS